MGYHRSTITIIWDTNGVLSTLLVSHMQVNSPYDYTNANNVSGVDARDWAVTMRVPRDNSLYTKTEKKPTAVVFCFLSVFCARRSCLVNKVASNKVQRGSALRATPPVQPQPAVRLRSGHLRLVFAALIIVLQSVVTSAATLQPQ